MRVRRSGQSAFGPFSCERHLTGLRTVRLGRVACALAVVLGLVSGALFAASPAVAAPAASVSPNTALRDGQKVTVTITGDTPSANRVALACVTGATDITDCDLSDIGFIELDPSGRGTLEWTLAAVLYPDVGGPVDCRTTSCQLVVADGASATFATLIGLPLAFDPNAPLLPPPVVDATPTEGLVDGQTITVTGSGFRRGYPELSECMVVTGGVDGCDSAGTTYPDVVDGAFTTSFVVFSALELPSGQLDCRPIGACALAVSTSSNPARADTIAIPLGFDPNGPLPPIPEATAVPTTGLRDGQVVAVAGSGFRPSDFLAAIECAGAAADASCDYDTVTIIDLAADGSFALPFSVSAVLSDLGATGTVDCRTVADPCVVRVSSHLGAGSGVAIPLEFDPDAPTLPPPTISFEPTTGLTDGQEIRVVGRGFRPGAGVSIQQCVAGDESGAACDTSGGLYQQAGADGSIESSLPAAVEFLDYRGTNHVCDAAPGCELVAEAPRIPQVRVQLGFGPRPPSRGRYYDHVFGDVAVQRDIVYRTAVDSHGNLVDLKIDIYQPVGDTAPVRPAMVWLHGGYFAFGDKTDMESYARDSALRGYVSASVQYRLRPEIGANIDARSGLALLDAYDDADAAIAWLQEHAADYRIDPKAISAGGYSAGAVTSMNLAYMAGQRGPAKSRIAAAASIAGATVGVPEKGEPPSIMFHGDADPLVQYAWGKGTCDAANRAGLHCELVTYPGSGHEIASTRLRDIERRTATFLADQVARPMGFMRPLPVARPGGPYVVDEGSTVVLDGRTSAPASGGPLTYSWSPDLHLRKPRTATPTYVGGDDGTETVTLAVREGRAGSQATTRVRTRNVAPAIDKATVKKIQGQPRAYAMAAHVTDPGLDDTHVVAVDWGDATSGPGAVGQHRGSASALARHTYARAGAFTVRVTATDDDGASTTVTRRVTVG